MQLVPAAEVRTATIGDVTIARSADAVVVKEVGRGVYDPVVYFPRTDVDMERLVPVDTTTHCPLKGDTEYFDVALDGTRVPEVAWSYVTTIEAAAELRGLVAFDPGAVTVR